MTIHFTKEMVELWNLISPFAVVNGVKDDAPLHVKEAYVKFKELYKKQEELEISLCF